MESQGFPKFTSLPLELRSLIWGFSLPTNRTFNASFYHKKHLMISFRRNDVPGQLAACHESREQALRLYRPLFSASAQYCQQFYVHDSDLLLLTREFLSDTIERPFLNINAEITLLFRDALDFTNASILMPIHVLDDRSIWDRMPPYGMHKYTKMQSILEEAGASYELSDIPDVIGERRERAFSYGV